MCMHIPTHRLQCYLGRAWLRTLLARSNAYGDGIAGNGTAVSLAAWIHIYRVHYSVKGREGLYMGWGNGGARQQEYW